MLPTPATIAAPLVPPRSVRRGNDRAQIARADLIDVLGRLLFRVKDRLDAAHDYEVNLKAELEILALHEKLDELRGDRWNALLAMQSEQLEYLRRISDEETPGPVDWFIGRSEIKSRTTWEHCPACRAARGGVG